LGVVVFDGLAEVVMTVVTGEVPVELAGVEPVVTFTVVTVKLAVVTLMLAVVTVTLGVVTEGEGEGEDEMIVDAVVSGDVGDGTVEDAAVEETVEDELLSVLLPTKSSSRTMSRGTAVTVHNKTATLTLKITT